MYGVQRTIVKVLYKFDNIFSYLVLSSIFNIRSRKKKRIVFIGMGNHGFTLLAFFVCVAARQKISLIIDPSEKSKKLAKKVLGSKHYNDVESAILDNEFFGDIIYIASDHSSHTDHALISLDRFKSIYVEKPLFVNTKQMEKYKDVINSNSNIFTGFNRPYSPFFNEMTNALEDNFSVTMIINGHFLSSNHWYRDDGQGSRVLGNLTHWIDLSLRIFQSVNNKTTNVKIELSKGHLDDITLILTTKTGKVCLSFSANCEPSDGVEEYVFWNCPRSVGNIMNFRKMSYITKDGSIKKITKLTKDVGHKSASLAPINDIIDKSNVSYLSSSLALKVEEMYRNGSSKDEFSLNLK
jgi:hypothetical protein